MKTLKYIFALTLFIINSAPLIGQKSDQHITIKRGDYKEFIFRHTGNVGSSDITFVVKLTKSFSSPRLIQKANNDPTEISAIYSSPYTYIRVKLLQRDTRDFTASKYFYDIVADSTTIFDGELRVNPDVQTPFDGTDLPENATRITTVSLANGSLQNEYAKWDTTLKAWVPSGVVPGSGSGDEFDSTFVYQALSGKADINHNHTGVYEPVKGADDNYVTDAEKIKLSNLSGTNTGDQDLSNYASKTATQTFTGLNTFSGNKTVFGTTMNDSVGIRGRLNVDGIAKTTQIQNTDTTTSLATADRYGIEYKKVWQYAGTSASASYGFYNRSLFSLSSGMRLGSHYGFYQETDFGGTGGIMQPNIYGFYNKLIYSRSDTSAAGKFIYNYFADVAKTGIGSFGGQYYGYYSTISSGIINSIAYHFYGAGNYPSYFGGDIELPFGSLIFNNNADTLTQTELGYLDGLKSNVQEQLNAMVGGSVGNADSLVGIPGENYSLEKDSLLKVSGDTYKLSFAGASVDYWLGGINSWTNGLSSSSDYLRIGKNYADRRFNSGFYTDFWIIDYVIPPHNLSETWLYPIEHRTDYYNDTLKTTSSVFNLFNIDGTGTPIWSGSSIVIGGNHTNINFGDLPDSVGLSNSYAFGNRVQIGEDNKTEVASRFPMPFRMYTGDVASAGTYTYPSFIFYYSNLANVSADYKYHFYGEGNYPSYFGGNVEIDGSLILDGDTVTTTESIIGTTETLDSLILDYWNDNLGGGTWDSTYAYQRIVALETSVSNLQDSISSFRTILNSILTALDTCGCSASTADNTPPLAPTSYTAIGGTSETQYVTTWTDPIASDLDSIRWYEGSSNDTTAMTWITSIAGGVQTYTRTGRTANTTYWSAIKAIDDSGNVSWFSNIDSATTTGGAAPDTGLYKFDAEDGLANVTVNGDSVVVSTEQAYAGSYSYKIKGNGTANGVYMTIGSFPVAQTDTLWLTYRIYIPANTSTTQGWMLNVLFGYAGDWMTFGSGCLQGSGDIISAWQFPFGTEVTTNFSTGAWHKIEIVFLEGTGANAHSRAYVDETQVYTASDGDATEKPTRIALGAYNWYMDVGDAIYFDDIIISNDRLPLD